MIWTCMLRRLETKRNLDFNIKDFAHERTLAACESWHVLRWILRSFGLLRMLKHRLHPWTENILAHSTLGSEPYLKAIKINSWKKILKKDVGLYYWAVLASPVRCSLSDSRYLQCFLHTPHLGSWTEWYEILICSTRCSFLLYCLKHAEHLFLGEIIIIKVIPFYPCFEKNASKYKNPNFKHFAEDQEKTIDMHIKYECEPHRHK